jgi:hypothetical protein
MIIGKIPLFLILFSLVAIPLVAPRLIWIAGSRKKMAVMGFEGRGTAGEPIPLTYSNLYFEEGGLQVWFTAPPGLGYKEGDPVPVRYLRAAKSEGRVRDGGAPDARVDSLIGLWGDILVYGGIPTFILLILFLHPDVVPWGSRLLLTRKSPYIRLWSIRPN